jgi:hypothetical protein
MFLKSGAKKPLIPLWFANSAQQILRQIAHFFSHMRSIRRPAGLFIAFKEPSRGIALARRRHFPDNPGAQEAKIG